MRRITVYFICLFMMLGNIKFVSADTEINRIMNNKNQDVLFVGSVTYVSDNYFVLSAKDYINTESTSEAIAKRTEDHRYVIMKNENIKYTSSYHEKTTVEEGDHVIASLKKTKGKWIPLLPANVRAPPANPQASASQKGSTVLVDIKRSASQFISTMGRLRFCAAKHTGTAM